MVVQNSNVPTYESNTKFNKLEQLRTNYVSANETNILTTAKNVLNEENYYSKRERKQATMDLVNNLLEVASDSKVQRQYKYTFGCNGSLYVYDGKVTTWRCKNRWCSNCQRVLQHELIEKYLPIVATWTDKYFVTLTIKNVPHDKLELAINEFSNVMRKINEQKAYRNGLLVKEYIRKVEVTYNNKTSEYHPHLHLLVNTKESAQFIYDYWVKYWSTKYKKENLIGKTDKNILSKSGQDIRQADNSTIKEIVKYLTKMSEVEDYKALNNIYEVMKGKRIIQPVGLTKYKYMQKAEQQAEQKTNIPNGLYQWSFKVHDWIESVSKLGLCTTILPTIISPLKRIENVKVFSPPNLTIN